MIKIRNFIFGIILTLIVCLVFEILILNSTSFYNKTSNVYKGSENVILLGNSRTLGSFIPDSISKGNVYNYGLPGTNNKLWINQLYDLSKDKFSQTIIVNVDETRFLDNNNSSDGDFRSYLKLPKESFVYKNLSHVTKSKLNPFPFYYFGEIDVFLTKFIREKIQVTGFTNKGCRIEMNILSKSQFQKTSSYKPIEKTIIPKSTHNILKSIEKKSNELKGDRIIFVSIPIYGKSNKNVTLNKIKLEYPSLGDFHDLSQLYKKREYYYDGYHPSLKGAIILSDTLNKIVN